MLQTVDMADIRAIADERGLDFTPGNLVRCDRCLDDCLGFSELREELL